MLIVILMGGVPYQLRTVDVLKPLQLVEALQIDLKVVWVNV